MDGHRPDLLRLRRCLVLNSMAFGACPSCGSRRIRSARLSGFAEHIKSVVGLIPFRCRECDARFESFLLDFSLWRYARCPKCLRTDLSTWSEHYYRPPFGTRLFLRLGATPYRCEFCRCNFASFRACKERFSWRKRPEETGQSEKAG